MNIDEINKKIQAEKEHYNRTLNKLEKEILNLKSRHQRTMTDLHVQKEQIKQQNQQLEDFRKLLEAAGG